MVNYVFGKCKWIITLGLKDFILQNWPNEISCLISWPRINKNIFFENNKIKNIITIMKQIKIIILLNGKNTQNL